MHMEFEGGDVNFLENENDIIGEIDWDFLFDASSTLQDVLELDNPVPVAATGSTSPSSPSSTVEDTPSNPSSDLIGQIETILMKDDDGGNKIDSAEPVNNEYYDNFLADILADSPCTDSPTDVDSNGCADSDREKVDLSPLSDDAEADDPISKKRRRQLRNKDAALKSRERKKMYVRDLEIKAKYFEGECRRLGRLLQCCYAENNALRLSLEMKNAYAYSHGHGHGVSGTKQESAVLFMELLLLGSLLWCLDIMCLLVLPLILINPLNNGVANERALESVGLKPRGAASNSILQSFSKTRRCKASRTKMKHSQFPCFMALCGSFPRALLLLAT